MKKHTLSEVAWELYWRGIKYDPNTNSLNGDDFVVTISESGLIEVYDAYGAETRTFEDMDEAIKFIKNGGIE